MTSRPSFASSQMALSSANQGTQTRCPLLVAGEWIAFLEKLVSISS